MHMPSDDESPLITAAQAGDATAFESLLGRYYDLIFRFALRWSGNRSDAEDITQNACMKLARNINQFRFESAFSSWLYRLVINCAKDWYKSQGRHRSDESLDSLLENTCEDAVEISIYLRQVLNQLDTLADGFKETALLVHAEGLSHAQAAVILNIKESTVSWRLHEIRKHLQATIAREGVSP